MIIGGNREIRNYRDLYSTIKEDWDTCLDDAITPANRICNNIANELDLTAYKNVTYEEYK